MANLEFPIGTIIAWENTATPSGWAVCDGDNGTPDLRNKFIRGASEDGDVRSTGGAETHTHTNPDTETRLDHDHGGIKSATVGGAGGTSVTSGSGASAASTSHTHGGNIYIDDAGEHDHTVGDTESESSLPPYIKRVFIRRVS